MIQAALYGHAVAERGPLGGRQLGGTGEGGDLAGQVEVTGSSGPDVLVVGGVRKAPGVSSASAARGP
ncbi:hypothetical protein ADK70_37385 [Streptomyces rimosus subsp. pseudoverticillatus]|nr:hypothetical protein ADK70_37385 [Streptomyces rimosus subsp. pseudoverticillatus]